MPKKANEIAVKSLELKDASKIHLISIHSKIHCVSI